MKEEHEAILEEERQRDTDFMIGTVKNISFKLVKEKDAVERLEEYQ